MFSTKKQLMKRTGKSGVGRFSFLQQLVNEFNNSQSKDAKEQVLANLANFAYDPINYEYLWQLKIIDVFFSAINENNNKLISFGIGGICNICLEPLSRFYIIKKDGIKIISALLAKDEESIILSAITSLIFLNDLNLPEIKRDIASSENINLMLKLSYSSNLRIRNLAKIFLKDLCDIHTNKTDFIACTNLSKSLNIATNLIEATPSGCTGKSNRLKKKRNKTSRIVMSLN